MAKILRQEGQPDCYEPGIIYDLGAFDGASRTPFYVGETSNGPQRLAEHRRAGRRIGDDPTSTIVYQTIKALDDAGIEWDMRVLAEYGPEGPTDLEDEWIMNHLVSGYKLANMKKGNANWMTERMTAAADMRVRNITSYRRYRAIITQEDLDKKHEKWLREQEYKKCVLGDGKKWGMTNSGNLYLKRIIQELDIEQTEKMAEWREKQKLKEQRQLEADARWAADVPAREARLRAETERLQAREELERQRKIDQLYDQRKANTVPKEHHSNLLKTGLFEEVKK